MHFTTDRIFKLSERAAVLDFQDLLKSRREKGFQHFILDLKNEPDARGNGWTLSGGLLTVKEPHNTEEIMQFLEDKLKHHPWFQTREGLNSLRSQGKIIETPQLPVGFESYTQQFKSLGYWGKNPAMDVCTFLLEEDGSIAVQVIVRPFDRKYAFVGGMIDKNVHQQTEAVLAKCFDEFVEEFYSNDLFARGSETLRRAASFQQTEISNAMQRVLATPEFKRLDLIKPKLQEVFDLPNLAFNNRMTELETRLNREGATNQIRSEDLSVFLVRIKCKLYQELFPDQYQAMINFLRNNLIKLPETTNEADPRNTQAAFMTTTPYYFCLNRELLKQTEKSWYVAAKGGDDALSVKILKLEKLFEHPMYSAHGRILLEMVADLAEKNPQLLQNPVIQQQLSSIAQELTRREKDELGIEAVGTSVLQRVDEANALRLPVVSREAELEQLRTVTGAFDEMERTHSIEDAEKLLRRHLGEIKYARMEEQLETQGLPMSAKIVLADLAKAGTINLIIDNSSSMTTRYQGSDGIITNRWREAQRRLLNILPLISLAGVKIVFRFLNIQAGISRQDEYEFNFVQPSDSNDIRGLERKLQSAYEFVHTVFANAPEGLTYVEKPLQSSFQNHGGLTVLITDGDASDQSKALSLLNNRDVARNPLVVVACTNQSNEIGWIRNLARTQGSFVVMLDDYAVELGMLQAAHGPLLPYSNSTWVLLHLVAPSKPGEDTKGLTVYHLAAAVNRELSTEELAEVLGYMPRAQEYAQYLAQRQAAISAPGIPVAAMVPGFGTHQRSTGNTQPGPQDYGRMRFGS